MADSTLILLDPVSTPAPTDLFGVRQSGDSRDKKMTRAQVHTLESGEFLRYGWDSAIDVTGLTSQGDYVLSTSHNSVGTITADGQAVTLPATSGLVVGDHILVENDHATRTVFVFPAVSHTIYGKDTTTGNDRAVNVHVALGPKSSVLFTAQSGSGYEIVYRTNELTKNDVLGSTERDMTAPDTDGDIFGFSAHWSNAGGLPANGDGSILTKTYDSDYAAQIYQDWEDGALWVRGREAAGAWTAWVALTGAASPSINEQNSNYTTVLSDAGKTIYKATGGPPRVFTIDSNANVPYPIGTIIRFALGTSRNASVDITDDTLIWTIDGTVGERDLEEAGYAIAQKVEATTWKIVSTPQVLSFGTPLEADMPDGSLTADVSSIQGGGVIIAPYNVYSAVGTAGDAATLPAAFEIGTRVYIKNNDATESMDVFPASGDNLGEGIDVALAVPAGTSVTFIATSRNSIWTQLIVPVLPIIPTGGTVAAPMLAFGDGNTGFWEGVDNELGVAVGGVKGILFKEASSGVLVSYSANTGLTADAGSSQGDGVILSTYNVYTTVATTGDAATLPATFFAGTQVFVKNDTEASMDVFPASGDDAGAGTDTVVAVLPGTSVTFLATVANSTWTQLIAPPSTLPGGISYAGSVLTVTGTIRGSNTSSPWLMDAAPSDTVPNIRVRGSDDSNTGIGSAAYDGLSLICGGIEVMGLTEVGSGGLLRYKMSGALTANTNQTQGDTVLINAYNYISVCANPGDAVTLPAHSSYQGTKVVVTNGGAESCDVYPDSPTARRINGQANGTPYAVGPGESVTFMVNLTSDNWAIMLPATGNTTPDVGLTADVGSAQGSGVIKSSHNVYSTVANAGDAATLPAVFRVGMRVLIKNDAATNSMDVFPASGDDLGQGTDTVEALAAGDFAVYMATAADATWTKIMGGTA